jgi:hypothetical protein
LLNDETRKELDDGNGGELATGVDGPAKIQALHSSSALGVNVFDYWRGKPDISIITISCGLSDADHDLTGEIRFEQKYSIEDHFPIPSNIDVVIKPNRPDKHKVFAIECKFTEAYSSRGHGGLDSKYFENADNWEGLSATAKRAREISPVDNQYKYLHAAQMIKHILGLNRKYGNSHYRLLYLWYDGLGEPDYKHRQEIEEFTEIVRSDGVIFHATTYQDLIIGLAKNRENHSQYVSYLTERYL